MFHLDTMQSMYNWLQESPNLKVKSWLADISDTRLITMTQALSIMYINVSKPFWQLVLHDKTEYLTLYVHIQLLNKKLEEWIEKPEGLLVDDTTLFKKEYKTAKETKTKDQLG